MLLWSLSGVLAFCLEFGARAEKTIGTPGDVLLWGM